MAGPKSTVIEYAFEGNILNLEEAVKQVRKMLNSTAKSLRELQGGKLTKDQEKQIQNLRNLATQMNKYAKNEKSLTEAQKKQAITAGKYVLKEAQKLNKETKNLKKKSAEEAQKEQKKQDEKAAKEAEKAAQKAQELAEKAAQKAQEEEEAKQEHIQEATSVAGIEGGLQRAAYLEEYADKFKHVLSDEAYDDIKRAVETYRAAVADTSLSEEEMAEQVDAVNGKYKAYSAILQAINRSQQQASQGILSINDFFKESKRQISVSIKQFGFWLQMLKKAVQIASQFQDMLDQLNRSGQLNSPELKGWKDIANIWRSLSRQTSLFITNIGGLITSVLAPIANILSGALMIVNAILGAVSGVGELAENTRSKKGPAGIDELNSNQESEEDNLKKMQRGWRDLKEAMQPAVDLAAAFGQFLKELLSPIQLLFAVLQTLWNFLKPIFDGVLTGLSLIISGIAWLVGWIAKAINWFAQLLGVTGDWTKEGTVLYDVLKWIGIFLSGLVAIALTKYIVAAAQSFAVLSKNIAKATANLVVYIAKQLLSIANTIKSTIANWWENASLVAKIGLLTLGAGLVIVPIVLAATGAFTNQANSVPAMAKGGVVDSPTMALIGEGKYNEAVVPLGNSPQFTEMKNDIASSVVKATTQLPNRNSQGGGNTPVILEIDGRTLARALLPYLGYVQPQTGVRLK